MECWYDTLYECDCEGIYKLIKIPCIGNTNWEHHYRNQWGNITPMGPLIDKRLYKRVQWILNCAAAAGFNLITLDDWRSNRFKIFLEITSTRYWYEQYGIWYWATQELRPRSCYYLGQFPWYWDYDVKEPIWPSSSRIGNIKEWPYREDPGTGEYFPKHIYTRDDIILFYGEKMLTNIEAQTALIDMRKKRRTQCLKTHFPTPLAIAERELAMKTFNEQFQDAWDTLNLDQRRRPEEVFPRFKKEEFDKLRQDYIKEHGFVITIPKVDQVLHALPKNLKTPQQLKKERREGLMRVLASPSPGWYRNAASVMKVVDDLQDATSIIYPAISMLARWAPKVMGKLLPILGWMMLGGDLLNFLNAIWRLPLTGMSGKRLKCEVHKLNIFSKKAIMRNAERLRKYKPGIADLLQTAQTTDGIIGVGLSLGPIMGFIYDAFFGGLRYISGERVRFMMDPPDMFAHESAGRDALKAASIINTQTQIFDEETHFWSLVMGALGARLFLPHAYESDIMGIVDDPMNIMIPAPYPTDPLTLEVLKEEGIDPRDAYGWPMNEKKEIQLGELSDYLVENTNKAVTDYWFRHNHDFYGYVSAVCWDQILPVTIKAFDPPIETNYEDPTPNRIGYIMVKAPLLPTEQTPKEKGDEFFRWAETYLIQNQHLPGYLAIKSKLDDLHIPYSEAYPTVRQPDADEFWDKDLDLTLYTSY